MRLAIITLAILLTTTTAIAETTRGGFPGCVREDLFDDLMQAAARDDTQGIDYLMHNGCIMMKGGLAISVLDTTWTGKAKIRVYIDGQGYVMWTNAENIQR